MGHWIKDKSEASYDGKPFYCHKCDSNNVGFTGIDYGNEPGKLFIYHKCFDCNTVHKSSYNFSEFHYYDSGMTVKGYLEF